MIRKETHTHMNLTKYTTLLDIIINEYRAASSCTRLRFETVPTVRRVISVICVTGELLCSRFDVVVVTVIVSVLYVIVLI